jgi:hypothetical protein
MEIVIWGNNNVAQRVVMIPNLTATIIIIITIPVFILLLFLPAIIELKKPKDGGPRLIMGELPKVNVSAVRFVPIANMEAEQKFDSSLIQTMAKIIGVLPSLEV